MRPTCGMDCLDVVEAGRIASGGGRGAGVWEDLAVPRRASIVDLVLLGVAVVAVSSSAPLIRAAAAPTLAIALWRNLLALPATGAWVLLRAGERAGWRARSLDERRLSRRSGLLLAGHFATWVPSLSFTSVASSVALVATQPVWAALIARRRGEHVGRGTVAGIAVAFAGALALTGVDLTISARALFGDLLALAGGILAAAYVTVGAQVRQTLSTAAYTLSCYGTAAAALLAVCVVSRQDLWGYDGATWLAIVGLVAGPQLLGHTLVNRVLRTISPTIVSVAILFEILGASVLAWLVFDEVPPAAAWPAAALIATGVVLVVRDSRRPGELVEPSGVVT